MDILVADIVIEQITITKKRYMISYINKSLNLALKKATYIVMVCKTFHWSREIKENNKNDIRDKKPREQNKYTGLIIQSCRSCIHSEKRIPLFSF